MLSGGSVSEPESHRHLIKDSDVSFIDVNLFMGLFIFQHVSKLNLQ